MDLAEMQRVVPVYTSTITFVTGEAPGKKIAWAPRAPATGCAPPRGASGLDGVHVVSRGSPPRVPALDRSRLGPSRGS